MLLAIGLGIVLALAFAFVQARQIAGPVRRLALATRRVQDGDYAVAIDVSSGDEIGVLARAFKGLVEDLKEKSDLVEYMMRATGAAATQPISAGPTDNREVAGRPSITSGGDVLRPGSTFAGRYEIKEVLGVGGMGVVYRALDRELREPVAIKTLRPEALTGDSVALERFKQEIRLARRIAHRNVVRTYDLGEVNGMYYLTMEFVGGGGAVRVSHRPRPLRGRHDVVADRQALRGGAPGPAHAERRRAGRSRQGRPQSDGEEAGGAIPERE